MNTQVIKYDDDGFFQRVNKTSGELPTVPGAGFIFHSQALQVLQSSRAWSRFPDIDRPAPSASADPAQLTNRQKRALLAQRMQTMQAQHA